MSARPMTKSVKLKALWAATADLGARAKALAEREGIPLVEAYPKALAAIQREDYENSGPLREWKGEHAEAN